MAYNAEKTLSRAIDSVLAQTHTNFVYYLVDNGSEDSTGEIISEYAKKDKRIIHLKNKQNHVWEKGNGLWCVIEQCLDEDLFCTLDADDAYLNSFFEDALAFIEKHSVDIAAGGSQFYSELSGEKINQTYAVESDLVFDKTEFNKYFRACLPFMFTIWGKMYRLPILRKASFKNVERVSYGHDTVYATEAFSHAQKIGIMGGTLHKYYIQQNSVIRKFNYNRITSDQICCDLMLEFLKNAGADTYANKEEVFNSYAFSSANTIVALINSDIAEGEKLNGLYDIFNHSHTKTAFKSGLIPDYAKKELQDLVVKNINLILEKAPSEAETAQSVFLKMNEVFAPENDFVRDTPLTISLCMIVKNEEAVLERCLNSIKDAVDEIIVVDTGSTDKTKQIAAKFTDKIYDFKWINDFSAARNFSFSKASKDYQFFLDADDVFPKNSLAALLNLKKTLHPSVDIVTMKYVYEFDGEGNPLLTTTRERLFKRENNYVWIDPVHECVEVHGAVLESDIDVHHFREKQTVLSTRNLKIYEEYEKSGKELTARQTFYYARELKDHEMWQRAAECFERFLNFEFSNDDDKIEAHFNLAVCYKQLKKDAKILPILLNGFIYDTPRAEACVELGFYYQRQGNFALAYKWFALALSLNPPQTGFVMWDYYTYIPHVECAICCYKMGDFEGATGHNEQAARYKPNDPAVLHNREIFNKNK
jgi:glycosyltransferase involved in cell wall biosynthesis